MRHQLVQRIVRAYEDYKTIREQQLSLALEQPKVEARPSTAPTAANGKTNGNGKPKLAVVPMASAAQIEETPAQE